jgi:hypothetical protein
VVYPIARAIFDRIQIEITGCPGYISDEETTEYLHAVETLVSELRVNLI